MLELTDEVFDLDVIIGALVGVLASILPALSGLGVDSGGEFPVAAGDNQERLGEAAPFAMFCWACPISASSKKTVRHRLNRGGNRQANSAVHMVVACRMRTEEHTKAYVERRSAEGRSKREIMRYLKRYVVRKLCKVLVA